MAPNSNQPAVMDGPPWGNVMAIAPVVHVVADGAETRARIRRMAEGAGLGVRAYADADALLVGLAAHEPGCLVLGGDDPAMNVAEVRRALGARGIDLPIIVAGGQTDVASAVEAIKGGAVDVIEPAFLEQRLLPAILRAISAGLATRSARLHQDEIRLRYLQLTPRERQVLALVVEGATSAAIATRLGVHEKTVEIYRSHINKKMGTRNAVELTRLVHGTDWRGEVAGRDAV